MNVELPHLTPTDLHAAARAITRAAGYANTPATVAAALGHIAEQIYDLADPLGAAIKAQLAADTAAIADQRRGLATGLTIEQRAELAAVDAIVAALDAHLQSQAEGRDVDFDLGVHDLHTARTLILGLTAVAVRLAVAAAGEPALARSALLALGVELQIEPSESDAGAAG